MSEFDDLLEAEPVTHHVGILPWEGEIPASVLTTVEKLVADGKPLRWVPREVPSAERVGRYKSVLKAAVSKISPDKALNTRDKHNDEGTVIGFTFSVGAPRGRKPVTPVQA